MARKARETQVNEAPVVDSTVLQGDLAEADSRAPALLKVMEQFGDGLPYDRTRLVDKCRYHMARSAEEALEVGRCLIVMREHEPHGEWLRLLEEIGMQARAAQRMIQAAVKFSNASTSTHLIEAAKSKSKLLELMILDDEDLQTLADGGTVADLTLDDVDRMPVSELRRALRDTRAQNTAKDRLLATKDAKLNELASAAAVPPVAPVTAPWDDKVAPFKAEVSAHFDILEESVGRLVLCHDAILQGDFGEERDPDGAHLALRTCAVLYGDRLRRLTQQVAELQQHYEGTLAGWAAELDGQVLEAAAAGAEA